MKSGSNAEGLSFRLARFNSTFAERIFFTEIKTHVVNHYNIVFQSAISLDLVKKLIASVSFFERSQINIQPPMTAPQQTQGKK